MISDGDTDSVPEDMVCSASESCRYPLRSSRTLLVVSAIHSNEVYEGSGNQSTRKSERGKRQVKTTSHQRHNSQIPNPSGHLSEKSQPRRPTLHPSRPSASTMAMAMSHMNPLFLKMAHWINENTPIVSTSLHSWSSPNSSQGDRSPHDEPQGLCTM
jgi:hypothetical protein